MNKEVLEALAVPFDEDTIEYKVQAVSKDGQRAMAVAYVDARTVAERLDEATGGDWEFTFEVLSILPESVAIKGSLTVCGVTRQDVGEYQQEGGSMEMFKAAVSDALKRSAVLFGLGRDLYRQERQWVPYDKEKKVFKEEPRQKASTPKPSRTQKAGPYDELLDSLNNAFGAKKTLQEVFTEIHGAKKTEDETKAAIALWFFKRGMEVYSKGNEYDEQKVFAFIKEQVTDDSAASLPARAAALKKYFEG